MGQRRITDDLQALMDVLPPAISEAVKKANNSDNLLEIVLDLGRRPFARLLTKTLNFPKRKSIGR